MNFQPKKFEQIYGDMVELTRQKVPNLTDFQVGSVIRTLYESFAYEMAVLYEQMNGCYNSAFIDTATGTQLDMLVALLGIQRGEPDFAIGEVTFEGDLGTKELDIPLNTLVTTQETEKDSKKSYVTIETAKISPGETQVNVQVQAKERGEEQKVTAKTITVMPIPITGIKSVVNLEETKFTGKRAETDEELRKRAKTALISSGRASLNAIQTTLLSLPSVQSSLIFFPSIKEVKLVERFVGEAVKFGVLDLYVDGIDFDNKFQVQYLRSQVDKVRAAGVYVDLKPAEAIYLDGIFKIEINPGSDRQTVEKAVHKALNDYLSEMKMGQNLLFSQLIKQVLSVPNVSNLDNFEITTQVHKQSISERFKLVKQKIEAGKEYCKFKARHLFVATEIVPVSIRVIYESPLLDSQKKTDIDLNLKEYFKSLSSQKSNTLRKADIQTKINQALGEQTNNLKLKFMIVSPLESLSPFIITTDEEITVSSLETVALEKIYAYQKSLYLVGAMSYRSSPDSTETERKVIEQKIREGISKYLEGLAPESSVEFEKLAEFAQQEIPQKNGEHIATTEWTVNDFRAIVNNQTVTRINNQKTLSVLPLEKVELGNFLISYKTEYITVSVESLVLNWVVQENLNKDFNDAKKKQASDKISEEIKQAFNNFKLPETGKPVTYQDIRATILNLASLTNIQIILNGITYNVKTMSLKAISTREGIGKEQIIAAENQFFYIRSLEKIQSITIPSNLPIFE
ncbi:baseplate J/gp47 family protein [Nostoc sp. ChiQUE01b]|uniref:baseplate J/gp47 family protein n=1 Tax=Nostoc sp. ChiQUE01b TaxID=3075376 RepID=UPI002AD2B787|nr:baseplate J/gp47 family protein [Nostoc sp. ChiQUE01b]MDZ8263315.1 baseplate J/gp47 family protein [Nostoc sp. ChiQUE01b]